MMLSKKFRKAPSFMKLSHKRRDNSSSSSTSSYSSSPMSSPSPLSFSVQSISSPESELMSEFMEEDLTTMEFLDDPKDVMAENNGDVVEESAGVRDPDYYMEMVVFKVEDGLYRVPVHLFRSCTDIFNPLFDELNDVPQHERILKRDDVSKEDFRALLKLLYPLSFTLTRTLSDNEWISVLKVSTRWLMLDIRRMAIEHLTSAPLPLVDRIVLAREYGVVSWLRSAYLALVEPDSELSSHNDLATERIGAESSFKLHRVRESLLPERQCAEDIHRTIEQDLGTELEMLSDPTEVECAMLAQKYGVYEWRRSALVEIASRQQHLSVTEAQILGLETAIRLCGARELRASLGAECAVDQELQDDFGSLKSSTAAERAVMARKYGVRNWVKGALQELGVRKESLSTLEALDIGLRTAISLCRARHYSCQLLPDELTCRQALELEFRAEFDQVEAAAQTLIFASQYELQLLEEERWEKQRLEKTSPMEQSLAERQEEQLWMPEMEAKKEMPSADEKERLSIRDELMNKNNEKR